MRIYTYCGVLLLGAFFIRYNLKEPASFETIGQPSVITSQWSSDTPQHNNTKNTAYDMQKPTPQPEASSPSSTPLNSDSSLRIRNKNLSLGDSLDSILDKLGAPSRILETEYDFKYYVYNWDYSNLIFAAIKDDQLVGFYTDSLYFNFKGIKPGMNLDDINSRLNSSFLPEEILTYKAELYTLEILMDKAVTGLVVGINVLDNHTEYKGFHEDVLRDIELMNYDLVNSIRARNGLSILSWSSSAARASRAHSADMAEQRYFNHVDPLGSLPADRLREVGLAIISSGENIIAGYGASIYANHAWFNSPTHRRNMLNPEYISLGVGFIYQEDSQYKSYMTQSFYR